MHKLYLPLEKVFWMTRNEPRGIVFTNAKAYYSPRHAGRCLLKLLTCYHGNKWKVSCVPDRRPSRKTRKTVLMSGDDSAPNLKVQNKYQMYVRVCVCLKQWECVLQCQKLVSRSDMSMEFFMWHAYYKFFGDYCVKYHMIWSDAFVNI